MHISEQCILLAKLLSMQFITEKLLVNFNKFSVYIINVIKYD